MHVLSQALGGHAAYTHSSFNVHSCPMRFTWVRKLTLRWSFGDLLRIPLLEREGEREASTALSDIRAGHWAPVPARLYLTLAGWQGTDECSQWLSWSPVLGTVAGGRGRGIWRFVVFCLLGLFCFVK